VKQAYALEYGSYLLTEVWLIKGSIWVLCGTNGHIQQGVLFRDGLVSVKFNLPII